jgi:glycerol-3-phosphate acyltransferase PlsY
MITDIVLTLLGYLCGSISTAIIVCRLWGLPDPRTEGSHNPGATNVLRVGGKVPAAITLGGDLLKGLAPVLLASSFGASEWGLAGTALAAFLGHLYPVFFGFTGGKGVATAFGALLGLAPWVALAALATWLAMAATVRISSVSALTAAGLTPFYAWWLKLPPHYVITMLVMVALLIWRHRSNIRNLWTGTEDRINVDKTP